MDPTSAAILSAGVPALVAALTFVFGEVLKAVRAQTDRENVTIDRLLDLWADVGAVSTARLKEKWVPHPERVDLSAAMGRILMVFPKRDHVMYTRQVELADQLIRQTSDLGRVKTAGQANSELLAWAANRREGRRAANALVSPASQAPSSPE